jgi:hypothetical protein
MTAEVLLAAIGLAACVVMLARMAIGARRRDRLDAWLRHRWVAIERGARGLWGRRRERQQATREATDLIDRARRGKPRVDRDGNVYRPRSFNGSGDDDAPDGRHRRDH